ADGSPKTFCGIDTAEITRVVRQTTVPWFGKVFYWLIPFRRGIVRGNLRRAFGDFLSEADLRHLAQAYYAHYIRFLIEFVRLPFMSRATRQRWIRVENMESPIRAHDRAKRILLLTRHFATWALA